jgi:putative phage-type endonuclease
MTRRTTIVRPGHDDWLALRHRYIGASEIAAILGEHPFLTAAELAARKLTATGGTDNQATIRGRYLEGAVAVWWADEHGVKLVEPECVSLYDDYLIATLDRLAGDEIVEIKTTATHCPTPRAHWLDQVQAQMLCTGYRKAHIVVLDASLTLATFDVDAEPVHQMTLFRAAATFLDYIRRGELPPELAMTYRAATILHPKPQQPAVELDDDTLACCDHLRQVQAEIKALERDEDRLKGDDRRPYRRGRRRHPRREAGRHLAVGDPGRRGRETSPGRGTGDRRPLPAGFDIPPVTTSEVSKEEPDNARENQLRHRNPAPRGLLPRPVAVGRRHRRRVLRAA